MRARAQQRAHAPAGMATDSRAGQAPLRGVLPRIARLAALALAAAVLALPVLADPPGRVGRLSAIEGGATVQMPDGEVVTAEVNLPVTSGLVLETAGGARAEVRIGSIVARIGGDTALRFTRIDDARVALALDRGTLALRLRARDTVGEVVVQAPEGDIGFGDVGRYRVDVGRIRETTVVYVERGFARLLAAGVAVDVHAGRALAVEAGAGSFVAPLPDVFDAWTQAGDRRDDTLAQAYVSPEMTGYEDLAAYGDWRTTAAYGAVWVPRALPAGWTPYGHGRWRWIAPWGWTWIDAAPWGFAPFHYGRWCRVDGVWGWSPGLWVPRPVYAPALVGWIGRPGWSIAYGGVPAAGWVPLAPREPFVPWYRASAAHVQNINDVQVPDIRVYRGSPPPSPGGTGGAPAWAPASAGVGAFANAHVPNALRVAPASAIGDAHRIGGSPLAASSAQPAGAQPSVPIAPLAAIPPLPPARDPWGGVTSASPPPLARPGAGVPIAAPAIPGGALADRGRPFVRPAVPQIPAAPPIPPMPRFGSAPSGLAGAAPHVAWPPTSATTIPSRPSYAPPMWAHPAQAPPQGRPPATGIAAGLGVPHSGVGGLPANAPPAAAYRGGPGGHGGAHR